MSSQRRDSSSTATPWLRKSKQKVIDPRDLVAFRLQVRDQKQSLATLNGSFDLLHAGHLHILYEASQQADLLLVALNSDESIRQYKSQDRPIVPLQYRIELLSALGFVDYITWFHELDPRLLLERVRPDVHVNGAEYGEQCIEAETVRAIGARLHLVDRIPGLATSEIIAKIRSLG